MVTVTGISHLLLDIEGTTCPVSFVAEVLFPYAAQQLVPFVQQNAGNPAVEALLADVQKAWQQDADPEAQALRERAQPASGSEDPSTTAAPGTTDYLQLLIRQDRKLTALKDLQGLIWRGGYGTGELVAPLYPDVPAALQRWNQQGIVLAVYSSGSVAAQQLLYGHSQAGDLCPVFSHWFDTRTGAKNKLESYRQIAQAMHVPCKAILFVSDSLAECEAAAAAGLQVVFSKRAGNPQQDAGPFPKVSDYSHLVIQSAEATEA
jgi:enolase-phosphatase E1